MMHGIPPNVQEFPLKIAGSSVYGRYSKISTERTYNMIVSDEWLVPTPGYIKKIDQYFFEVNPADTGNKVGRGIYKNSKLNCLYCVIGENIFKIASNYNVTKLTSIPTKLPLYTSKVYIVGNNAGKIIISDGLSAKIWIIDSVNSDQLTVQNLPFIPGYLEFQDDYFIAASYGTNQWRLAFDNELNTWPNIGYFKSGEDTVQACLSLPGRGSQLFIFGKEGTESWVNAGKYPFPYQKNSGYSLGYGCISRDTISKSGEVVCWLAGNRDMKAVIMYSTGGEAIPIFTDGINFKLSTLSYPESSTGFLYNVDGHLLYHLTFYKDDFSLIYDFNTKKFFDVTDKYHGHHPARCGAAFNNTYCFLSIYDGSLYLSGTQYTTYDGATIPRVRITNNTRFHDSKPFVVDSITFPIEQGESDDDERIDFSCSLDGGVSYSNDYGIYLNEKGKRINRLELLQLGYANDYVCRFKFWSNNRVVCSDGVIRLSI